MTRRLRRVARTDELPESWYWALALGGDSGVFESDAQRRAAWFRYRHLIELNPCHRALGWWLYESPEPRSQEAEHEQLERLGVLRPEERAELRAWRLAGVMTAKGVNHNA